ncbi:uncharacterized protein K444DRAFT_279885 [Hyaloscypha bicolor E]|uniref:Uncharacterized protein n=1 Tax=Hyaloscypha bicolor E TaxID=1095630 RepID=A0A2J6SGZ2_9HELO|nr:uncharacterized protein K444DRAFT_279885 [Hyaloscypha bicolor E]PMD50046.1 hypothetical protein K444DRAFT_279885 [Hyaloscypha bicolor E]
MSLPLRYENPPTQRLTTPAPRDRTALERVVRKPAPTSHFIHPTNTTNTTNSRCDSALLLRNPTHMHPPAGCLQTKTPSSTHLPAHFATSNLLLQLVFLSSTPLEESQRAVSGAKNRAGVGVPLLAGLHLRQPSMTSSHLVGLGMRCNNTCWGRENGSDGESRSTAGGRTDGCVSSIDLSSWRWIRGLYLLLSVPTSIFIRPPPRHLSLPYFYF